MANKQKTTKLGKLRRIQIFEDLLSYHRWTPAELAERSGVGASQISQVLNRLEWFDEDGNLQKIARAFDVSPLYFDFADDKTSASNNLKMVATLIELREAMILNFHTPKS